MAVLQVNLTETNSERADAVARRVGKSTDDLVNEAVERYLTEIGEEAPVADWKAAWRQAAGMWKDRDDIPELMAQLRREWNRVEPPDGPLE
jgi:hypothetical protein